MDNKIIIIIVAIIVVAVGGLAAVGMTMTDQDDSSDCVTYYGNGEKTVKGETTKKVVSTEVVLGTLFDGSDKYFLVWNTKSDGSGVYYEPGDQISLGSSLYAMWGDHCLDALSLVSLVSIFYGLSVDISDDVFGEGTTRPVDSIMGLSSSGEATIVIYDWTSVSKYDDHTFRGKIGSSTSTYELDLTIEGASSYTLSTDGTKAYVQFTYDGDVKMSGVMSTVA